ncbi:MAG: hypothetical protein M1821_008783 [Bathelium mastoideum]|nr:MAG: hypothetical protein M1821_008783 [Bathelium mastoideum]
MANTDHRRSNQSIPSSVRENRSRNVADAETNLIPESTSARGETDRSLDKKKKHRHSLPTNAQLSNLWQDSSLKPPSDDHIAGSSAAQRATALRQLTGTPLRGRLRHRSTASTGSRTSLSSQPVLVRTYSGSRSRPASRAPPPSEARENVMGKDVKFLPADSFAFDGILRAIEPDVKDTIDAIAQIYARTNMSLADEYTAHMPPQGEITGNARNRQSGPPQRSGGNENTLSAVPEASSSSERLSDQGGRSKKSNSSSVVSGQRRKSAYGALMDVMAGSPPKDTTSGQRGKKTTKRDTASSQIASRHSASFSSMRTSQPGFIIHHPKPGTFSGASSIHSRTSSLGLTFGRSSTESQATSAHPTLDLSSAAIEASSARTSSQHEVHVGGPPSASGRWLPWAKSPKGDSSQNAEHVLKTLLHRTRAGPTQDAEGPG